MDDKSFMKMALNLAVKGRGFTSPNPLVGAVIVKDDMVVGSGYHEAVGKAHAEVNAIEDAGDLAKGATLYVTLEPCNHHGRTPPCTEKIKDAGISRVVIAMEDPNPDVTGRGVDHLKKQGIDISLGLYEDRATKLNEAFIKYVRTKRPFVIIKCAATLDGRIATRTGDSKWVSGKESRMFVHRLRHAVDAIMVGIDTVNKDNPKLTTRLEDIQGADPTRIILDTHLSISEDAQILHLESDSDTIIVTGTPASKDRKVVIEKKGVQILESTVKDGRIDLDVLIENLGGLGITSLLIEGGSRVIAASLGASVVDKVIFFFAPRILGGDDGVPICSGAGPELMSESIPLRDINVRRFGDDVMIEGYIATCSQEL
ncbi:MAG: bifunctional diaminohydroxyphosphoribosylaminopyrimidine deaminase/5-amino-6-(5-phosphoribosylamino)uracil reductase RibD [Deltaproteobacteria bacterium]|nr:bifunctional diaminohydroxyphosphoribosylaminopyrimidine deaminase/5-amino-6-(5-phosphoribosylamino)uracil reductase RibD [Deltaproteobacteria bacterium]